MGTPGVNNGQCDRNGVWEEKRNHSGRARGVNVPKTDRMKQWRSTVIQAPENIMVIPKPDISIERLLFVLNMVGFHGGDYLPCPFLCTWMQDRGKSRNCFPHPTYSQPDICAQVFGLVGGEVSNVCLLQVKSSSDQRSFLPDKYV